MIKPEILAPAGSYESMVAAIESGADAVYIGGSKFGARAFANNLTEDILLEAIDYVHLKNKKIYLTINTLFKEEELKQEFYDYLLPYYQQGIDAVIVQDMGVLEFIRTNFKDLPIHASTQMTISSAKGAQLLKEKGVTRVVTPRELSLNEIKEIKETVDVEIESFVHGALCYCYSGQCLLSSFIGGRSGNRGRCAQPCRLPYELYSGNKKISNDQQSHLLSPKDLCSIHLLPEMIAAGIDSLKIEGRMKKPEYVATVVGIYRKYLDSYWNNMDKPFKVSEKDEKALLELYNRGGFTSGYYKAHNGPDMMSLERSNHQGILVGKIGKIEGNTLVFTCLEDIHKQDVLEVIISKDLSIELTSPLDAKKGSKVTLNGKNMRNLKPSQPIYRTKNKFLIETLSQERTTLQKKGKLKGKVILHKDNPAAIEIEYLGKKAVYLSGMVSQAMNQPLSPSKVMDQIKKTGTTPYEFHELDIEMDEDAFVPVQVLKDLRRNGIAAIEEMVTASFRRKQYVVSKREDVKSVRKTPSTPDIIVSMTDTKYMPIAVKEPRVSAVYLDESAVNDYESVNEAVKLAHNNNKRLFYMLPHILRQDGLRELKANEDFFIHSDIDGLVIRNLEELSWVIGLNGFDKEVILDYTVYNYNQETIDSYKELLDAIRYTMPVELNFKELKMLSYPKSDMIIYGYLPVMVSAQCLVKNTIGCQNNNMDTILKDRFKKEFLVKNHCRYCYNTIYNEQPLALYDQTKDVLDLKCDRLRVHFVKETVEEAKAILDNVVTNFTRPDKIYMGLTNYTRGHFKRGIE